MPFTPRILLLCCWAPKAGAERVLIQRCRHSAPLRIPFLLELLPPDLLQQLLFFQPALRFLGNNALEFA